MTDRELEQAAQLYGTGLSLREVGERLGYDTKTIWGQLTRNGVRLRDTHGR